MSGTLRSIARLIRDGNQTVAECAARLGINRQHLEERLALMERQGYVARRENVPLEGGCTCGGCCSTCPRRDTAAPPLLYMLTEKGARLLKTSEVR
ncbi:hypothetical protein [Methanoregula sp.]|uniref:hypothetical protein n=1 Tax=Methanoregula sp. TaxID=2052170 RepID=UPI000CC5F32D|nr:hypothetical protein [Methanoregula sp.]PKG32434.1 MAG: hypothetical protein CW742_08160 [Methanoregula sp.]